MRVGGSAKVWARGGLRLAYEVGRCGGEWEEGAVVGDREREEVMMGLLGVLQASWRRSGGGRGEGRGEGGGGGGRGALEAAKEIAKLLGEGGGEGREGDAEWVEDVVIKGFGEGRARGMDVALKMLLPLARGRGLGGGKMCSLRVAEGIAAEKIKRVMRSEGDAQEGGVHVACLPGGWVGVSGGGGVPAGAEPPDLTVVDTGGRRRVADPCCAGLWTCPSMLWLTS